MLDDAARVELIKRLSGDIHRRLSEGPAAALNGPSACSEWDVGTVAAHLAGGAVRQREALLRGLAGEGGPPEGESVMPTADQVQQANAVNNVEMRREWGDALLDNFQQWYQELDDTLRDWTDWSIGCWHRRRGTISASSYLDLRIQELVIHDWDMRSGGAGEGELDADGAAALLPGIGDVVPTLLPPHGPADHTGGVSLRSGRRRRRVPEPRCGGYRRRLFH